MSTKAKSLKFSLSTCTCHCMYAHVCTHMFVLLSHSLNHTNYHEGYVHPSASGPVPTSVYAFWPKLVLHPHILKSFLVL